MIGAVRHQDNATSHAAGVRLARDCRNRERLLRMGRMREGSSGRLRFLHRRKGKKHKHKWWFGSHTCTIRTTRSSWCNRSQTATALRSARKSSRIATCRRRRKAQCGRRHNMYLEAEAAEQSSSFFMDETILDLSNLDRH